MIPQNELTGHDVRELLQETAQAHLPLEASGYQSDTAMLYDVLMKAASEGISIDAACRDLEETVDANTIRELLNGQLRAEELNKLEQEMNAKLPAQVQMKGIEAAIDEHDEACYAKTPALRAHTVRSRAKARTTRFSASLVSMSSIGRCD